LKISEIFIAMPPKQPAKKKPDLVNDILALIPQPPGFDTTAETAKLLKKSKQDLVKQAADLAAAANPDSAASIQMDRRDGRSCSRAEIGPL
jgi:hypothetical protein